MTQTPNNPNISRRQFLKIFAGLGAAAIAGGAIHKIATSPDTPEEWLEQYEKDYPGFDFSPGGNIDEYTVHSGDTLGGTIAPRVADELGIEARGNSNNLFAPTNASEIVKDMNPEVNWGNLHPGDKINIPGRENEGES
jgi:hypothetical protein